MKDVQWSFISLAISSFSHMLLRIILGKELGPSGLGLYTLVFTIYMFGMQFAIFGISAALVKYIAEYREDLSKIREFVAIGIVGSMVSGSVMGALLYMLSGIISIQFFHCPEMVDLLKITAFCFPFIAMQKTVLGTLNGLRKMRWFAIVNIVQNVSIVVISIALVLLLDMGVKGAVVGYVVPTIVVGLLSLSFTRGCFTTRPVILRTTIRKVLWFGSYIALANCIGLINLEIDSILIGHFINETEVGYYAVAALLVQGLILIPNSVLIVSTPAIATYYGKNDYNSIIKLVKAITIKISIITIFAAFSLIFFGQIIIEILFTKEFLSAYYPLLILIIGYSIYSPTLSISDTFSSIGKVDVKLKISVVCATINILLNILLIPIYGIIGAAFATSASLIFTSLVTVCFLYKYLSKPSYICTN